MKEHKISQPKSGKFLFLCTFFLTEMTQGSIALLSVFFVTFNRNLPNISPMTSKQFSSIRKKLGKTQKQLAELLGSSLKAIHSYEQGWRSIPPHAERQLLFLINKANVYQKGQKKSCWSVKQCPSKRKKCCPAWEFQAGRLCWFINGTICEGVVQNDWEEKMKICRSCEVMSSMLS